ncbi:MAG: ATP12 family protein [Acetobacteraceae bacterium]
MRGSKVFWSDVTIERAAADKWGIMLDGKPIILPAGSSLIVPSAALADKIADEWRSCRKNTIFNPEHMPITQLAAKQLERVAPRRNEVVAQLIGIFSADALFYRHGDGALGRAQTQIFAMPREKFEEVFKCALPWIDEIAPIDIAKDIIGTVEAKLSSYDDVALTGLSVLSSMTASLILTHAILYGAVTVDMGIACAFIEENAQMARWGRDGDREAGQASCRREIEHVLQYAALSATGQAV